MTTRMGKFARVIKKGMGGIGRQMKRTAHGMKSMAFSLATLGVLGAFAMKGLLGPAARFQKAMSGIDAVTLGTIENMEGLSAEARRLGRSTIFTATQVAQAMEIMGRAGLSGGEILGGIEPILNAAAAEGASIEETAKVVISTMKGFDLDFSLKQTTRVADVFAKVSASAKTNIIALGEGLSKVAPVAHQFGLNWEEMTAAVAALQDVGVEASMSGTQLKTMLNKLSDLTPKAAKGFRKLGIEIADDNKNMKQMPELLQEIFQGLEKTEGNLEKVRAIARAVGLRGAMAANILTTSWGKSEKGIKDLLEAIRSADDAAEKMNRRRQNNLLGDIIKLASAWEGFRIDIAKESLPELREFVQELTKALQDPENISKWAKDLNAAVKELTSWWSSNKDAVLLIASQSFETAKILAKIVFAISGLAGATGDVVRRRLGTEVDEETRQRHREFDLTGKLPPAVGEDLVTVKHMGQVHDVDRASGILYIELSDDLKPQSDAIGEIGIGPFGIKLRRPSGSFWDTNAEPAF